MLCTPWALSSSTRAAASDWAVRSFVISAIGTPSTPPSALTKSRAIWTPAYSWRARGACGPMSGKTAPTLTVLAAAGPVGAVAQAASTMATPIVANSRNRTGENSRVLPLRLFDALHQDRYQGAESRDADSGIKQRRDGTEGHPDRGRGGGGEHGERDPR